MHPRMWMVGAITGVVVLVSASSAQAVEGPTCNDVTATTTANHSVQVTFDCPTGSQPITYSTSSTPAHGSLSNLDASAGKVTYTPDAGYSGPDSFNYHAHNAGGDADKTVHIDVTTTITVNTTSDAAATGSECSAG